MPREDNIPLPPNTPVPVRVVVFLQDDRDAPPKHDRRGDHQDPEFRAWIAKTTHWAFRNGYSVVTYAELKR